MIIQILSLDMRKALKIALIPPGPDFCTQLHHAHIAVVSYEKFFKILDPDPDRIRNFAKKIEHLYPHFRHRHFPTIIRPPGDDIVYEKVIEPRNRKNYG